MEKYVTLVYLPEDEELANQLADEFAEKHVDVHLFEKHDLKQKEILSDIRKTACLILLHISEDFDYRYYLREIVKADKRCQTVAAFILLYAFGRMDAEANFHFRQKRQTRSQDVFGFYRRRSGVFIRIRFGQRGLRYIKRKRYLSR